MTHDSGSKLPTEVPRSGEGAASSRRCHALDGPLDLRGTFAPLASIGWDPTLRVGARALLRATRTPAGPATLLLEKESRAVRARAWGAGAAWALERLPDLLGHAVGDETPRLRDATPALQRLARRARGVRLPRTHRVVELLVTLVLQQKVTGAEASRAFRNLVRRFSEPAPGPFEDLWLPLGPEALRALPPAAFPLLGVPARQGHALRGIGRHARRLEEADAMAFREAERRLSALPGLGIWTARSAMLRGLGHADAVPLGDYHLPHLVAYRLAGEERADDARMLELLEPYRGQRGRVIRWLLAAGGGPPRRGPRPALRRLDVV